MSNSGVDLSVTIGTLKLKNPVMSASGTFGYGEDFARLIDLNDLGAIVVKGTTLKPRLGSPQHRFIEIAGGSGFLSNVGLQNVGVERFIAEKLPFLRQFNTPVIVNIAGESADDYSRLAEILNRAEGVAALEINLNCPNVKGGGMSFSCNPDVVFKIVKAVRQATHLSVIAKVMPGVIDVVTLAKVCKEAGADGIRPSAGQVGMAIDINTRRSKLGKNLTGGLGGPALKPVAIRHVWQVSRAVDITIVGGTGITCAEDAIEYFLAGATAVEIGTHNLIDHRTMHNVIGGIRTYLSEKGLNRMEDIIGKMIVPKGQA